MTRADRRVLLTPVYLLHQRPYRDSGRILEFFAREHGRVTVFARGVRRAGSPFLPVLQPFNRLLASWSAGADAGTFMHAEFDGAVSELPPARLLSGFYLNELLMRLMVRHDANVPLFDLYDATVAALKVVPEPARTLRLFEKRLLEALGYGLSLERESETGEPVQASATYRYRPDGGVARVDGNQTGGLIFSGASLLSLASEALATAEACADARRLLRAALDQSLEGRPLGSREVAAALRRARAADGA